MKRNQFIYTQSFPGIDITRDSFVSMEDAKLSCYKRAFERGVWRPRELRQKWWQFWLPKEHSGMELHFVPHPRQHGEDG